MRTLAFAGLLAGFFLALSAHAEPVLLDRIAVIVDDDVIMESDINRRLGEVKTQLASRGARLPPEDALRRQVMDRLIIESIQAQLASRMGIRIDDDTLNSAITGIAGQNNLSLREFIAQLASEGFDYASFREEVRRDMQSNRLRQRRVGDRVRISDADVDEFLRSASGRDLFADSYRLAHILVAVPDNADVAAVQAAGSKAASLLQQATDGADFTDLAIRNSEAADALEGGDLGWRNGAQLPSLFAGVVAGMKPGDVAGPLRSASGFHLVKLIDRKLSESRVVQQAKVRHILIKASAIRSSSEARELAQQLHDRISAGEDFAVLAKKHSDDPGSALAGGSLDWVSPGQMVEEFEQIVNATPLGGLSPVFETQYGWHFLQVQERREQDTSDEYRKLQARNAVWKRKFESELESWLRELRNEAFVEIKNAD